MYIPEHFAETRPEVLHGLIAAHPLGMLVTLGPAGLDANHIPFELAPEAGPKGTLRCHVARANAVWREFSPDQEALVIFQGPQAYITPSWYEETKPTTGKVVPTYNYCVVHAHGPLRIIEEHAWLRSHLERLTRHFEAGRPKAWKVSDAPADFVEKQLGAIVGIEIPLSRLTGKWKASQNRNEADRAGIVAGLAASGDTEAAAMARLVKERGAGRD